MFKEEFVKIVTNISFYFAIISVCILMMSGKFYVDSNTGREYTFFEVIFLKDNKEIIDESQLVAEEIILKGIESEYYEMFLPLVVSIPFIISIYADKKIILRDFKYIGRVK